jgi:hypothetical protein
MMHDYFKFIKEMNYSLYAVPPERFGLYKIGTKHIKEQIKNEYINNRAYLWYDSNMFFFMDFV